LRVLQHLSNAEIVATLSNVSQYPFALVSEHVPRKPRTFNRGSVLISGTEERFNNDPDARIQAAS
jgi:hypothetical protein